MFEENIVKMKKDQFTEAEAIACLINDEQKRKMAFFSSFINIMANIKHLDFRTNTCLTLEQLCPV